MTRSWDELVADLFDVIAPQYVLLILLLAAALAGALWYFYPAWIPRRLPRRHLPRLRFRRWKLPRWKLPRWRFKRRPKTKKTKIKTTNPEYARKATAPPPSPIALSLADRLAAEGRYAEAIRERLRETVGALTAAGVVTPEPGETAAELAWAASVRRPAVAVPLGGATELFSEVWYGDRPAGYDQDQRMRSLSTEVQTRLYATPPADGRAGPLDRGAQ